MPCMPALQRGLECCPMVPFRWQLCSWAPACLATPLSVLCCRALATSVTVARHLAPRRVSSRFRGSRHALESTSPAAASSGSPRAARPIKRVHSTPSLGSASAGAEAPEDEEPEEMSEVAEGDEAASTHGSGEAGAEEQQGEGKPARRRRRLVHSRSVAGGLVTKLAHVAAAPIAGVRGAVRRSHSDAMAAAQELAEQGALGWCGSSLCMLARTASEHLCSKRAWTAGASCKELPAPNSHLLLLLRCREWGGGVRLCHAHPVKGRGGGAPPGAAAPQRGSVQVQLGADCIL